MCRDRDNFRIAFRHESSGDRSVTNNPTFHTHTTRAHIARMTSMDGSAYFSLLIRIIFSFFPCPLFVCVLLDLFLLLLIRHSLRTGIRSTATGGIRRRWVGRTHRRRGGEGRKEDDRERILGVCVCDGTVALDSPPLCIVFSPRAAPVWMRECATPQRKQTEEFANQTKQPAKHWQRNTKCASTNVRRKGMDERDGRVSFCVVCIRCCAWMVSIKMRCVVVVGTCGSS